KVAKEPLHVVAFELPSNHRFPTAISPVNLKNRFGNVETDHVNFFWHGNILLFDHSPCSPLKGGGGRGRPCHHVRRRFYELAAAGPAPIASEALRRIAELYRVEDDIRSQPADAR